MASYQYSYVMKDLSKTFADGGEVLKGITLSFLPDAKIGVLGVNGAGKSTLLKIMAGQDPEFTGEAWAADGGRVGYLEQEPELDPSKDVEGNVMEGLGETKALLDKFNEISERFTEPMDDDEMNALLAEQGYDVQWPIWRGYYMGPDVSDEAYNTWVERLKELAGTEQFAEMRDARGLFPMERYGDNFDTYVKEMVVQFKELAKEVGLTQ